MSIFQSRKFWIAVFDVVLSCLTYFVPKLADPTLAEDILWMIAAWQPIFYALITGTVKEDVAAKSAGLVYDQANRSYTSVGSTHRIACVEELMQK